MNVCMQAAIMSVGSLLGLQRIQRRPVQALSRQHPFPRCIHPRWCRYRAAADWRASPRQTIRAPCRTASPQGVIRALPDGARAHLQLQQGCPGISCRLLHARDCADAVRAPRLASGWVRVRHSHHIVGPGQLQQPSGPHRMGPTRLRRHNMSSCQWCSGCSWCCCCCVCMGKRPLTVQCRPASFHRCR
jgi:hypothetical protein